MPLVRVEVRNEFGLGQPELYGEANREDPKAVLDAVAVAGLVGILRQLGDLSEFAAEVFHDLQEQVMTTASRSHKLKVRVQNIEAALPPLEKAVLAQTSHVHFAYTVGSEWHACIKNGQNHFIYNDLPRFTMDSYEECRDPPRLHLLDKFDTGGPGSCLKRYSDPTFFKRVSVHSDEAYAEKVQSDKKARKSKKKRSSQRNGELLRGASISNHSGRMRFISPIVNGRTSPSQTASTVDMTLKSDLGDHSNSFDSKTGSGYIECVFDMSSSLQPEEQESNELSSSRLVQSNDIFDSVSPGEQTFFEDSNFPNSSSQEHIAPSPTCVTWDEKTEIVEPKGQQCDTGEGPGRLPELDSQDTGAVSLHNVDQMDILFDDENTPKSISSSNQVDEIESEPDNYVDALNTIESESENDLDCQTKREVEQYPSNVENEGNCNGMPEFTAHDSDPHASNFESHTASYISTNGGMTLDLPNSNSSESFTLEQTPQIPEISYSDHSPGIDLCRSADILDGSKLESQTPQIPEISYSDHSSGIDLCRSADILDGSKLESQTPQIPEISYSDHSPGIDLCRSADILDGSKLESVIRDPSSSGPRISDSPNPWGDRIISHFDQPQESLTEFSGVHSVQFWTNGGLLGLEPSKPPDFSVSNGVTEDSVSRSENETAVPSNGTSMLKGDKPKMDMLEESDETTVSTMCSTSFHDRKDGISTEKTYWGLPQADAKFGDSHRSNINHSNKISVMAPTSALPLAPDVKISSIQANKENDENSPRFFGLSHRFVNGFRRNVSLFHDDKSEPATSIKTGVSENISELHGIAYQKTSETTFKEPFGRGSSVDSPSSSPPLEHMKISFHPINDFETYKLKLKIPDGTQCHESIGDMFPSFQLVPEPAIVLHDIDSNSDDDTFCRSSPYMSDDCLSHHSQSNSEQWESGETPGSEVHELYDALGRISSTESTSSSLELGEMAKNGIHVEGGLRSVYSENGEEHSPASPLLDLPNFDALNCVLLRETNNESNPKSLPEEHYPREPTPLPPPLPPVEWRVSKSHLDSHLDSAEEKNNISETFKHAFDPKMQSTVPQQPKTAPAEEQQTEEEAIAFKPKSKKQDQHLLDGQKEAKQAENGKEMDEREDFLQQIRTKSFNLRRTATARPTNQVPTASVKVTAILEKANAIRQAVGSDDGEDDNWSDT